MAETDTHRTFEESEDEFEQIVDELGPEQIYGKLLKLASMASTTHIGQFVLEKVDKVLSVIETTGKWSLPQIPEGEKGSQPPLERPLPWIPFLMLIVGLRSLRIALSLVALMIGNDPISATDMVYFVQIRRRKLRSFRYQGFRALKIHQQNQNQNNQQGIISRAFSLLGRMICRPGNIENTYVSIGKQSRISEERDYQLRKQPASSSDEEIVDETVQKILEVYSKVMNEHSVPAQVQSKSQLNKESAVLEEVENTEIKQKEPEVQNGEDHKPNSENVPENDSTPPPEEETAQPPKPAENHKTGTESGTEPARNHQSVVAATQIEDEEKEKENPSPAKLTEVFAMIDGCHYKCLKIKVPPTSATTCNGNLSSASSSEDLFFSPIGTPEFEFDFDEYLKNKKATTTNIDDVHQSDKNIVQNGKVHHNSGSKSSNKKHSSRMNGRAGTGRHI